MLELRNIEKRYSRKGPAALSDISLTFENTGLVAVCGPMACGKSTLLNIIGGIEKPDAGKLVIDGKPMGNLGEGKRAKHRNSRVGIAFQEPMFVGHRNVFDNVELALTISGVGRGRRRAQVKETLSLFGISECAAKKPAELSGAQRRLASLARAFAKNPEILIADEPTSGLDKDSAETVMQALKRVSEQALVIMATSDTEQAARYATRIIRLDQGKIAGDKAANRRALAVRGADSGRRRPLSRGSMPFFTAVGYSLRNMATNKARAILATFACAISMLGIAAIAALCVGTNNYINAMEEASIATDPIVVGKSGLDLTGLLGSDKAKGLGMTDESENPQSPSPATAQINTVEGSIEEVANALTELNSHVRDNDLAGFKQYVDSNSDGILDLIDTVQYDYGTAPLIYNSDTSHGLEMLNPSTLSSLFTRQANSTTSTLNSLGSFNEILDNRNLLAQQMDVVCGEWPDSYDECVVALDADGKMSDLTLYNLGLYDHEAVDRALNAVAEGEAAEFPEAPQELSYDQLMATSFTVLPKTSLYQANVQRGTWADKSADDEYVAGKLADDGMRLKVVGIVRPKQDAASLIPEGVGYTHDLTKHLIEISSQSEIVKQQLSNHDVDVFTGKTFAELKEDPSGNLDWDNIVTINQQSLDHLLGMFKFDLEDGDEVEEPEEGEVEVVEEEAEDPEMKEVWDAIEQIDWSQFEINTRDILDAVNAQRIYDAIALSSMLDPEESGLELDEEQQEEIRTLTGEMVADFTMYSIKEGAGIDDLQEPKEVKKYWRSYLDSEDGNKKMTEIDLLIGKGYGDVVRGQLEDYLLTVYTEVIIDEVAADIIEQALDEVERQLAAEVERQLPIITEKLAAEVESAISAELERIFVELDREFALAEEELDAFLTQAEQEIDQGATAVSNDLSNLIQINLNEEDLVAYMNNLIDGSEIGYDNNMSKLGYADTANPLSMSIYPKNLEAKHKVVDIIATYNVRMDDAGMHDRTIIYNNSSGDTSEILAVLVDVVGVAVIALMSLGLLVGCIMMVVIICTGVSARRREMGLLRALGTSRSNLMTMFNVELLVEGLLAGGIAIGAVYAISAVVNNMSAGSGGSDIMVLPPEIAIGIVALSGLLSLLVGLVPSLVMSMRTPVSSLRE